MDLTVVLVKPCVSERVQQTFEAVVHVTSPVVRGIELDIELHRTGVFRHPVGMEPGDDLFTVFPAVTGDEHPRSHVTVVVIHAGRPRKFEFRRHCCRAHGGADGAADGAVPCWGGCWGAAGVTAPPEAGAFAA